MKRDTKDINTYTETSTAKIFSKLLLKHLGAKKMKQVVARNKAEKDKNICHTHDFCDANMVMDEALKEKGFELDIDLMDDKILNLWNEAWSIAKANKFWVE